MRIAIAQVAHETNTFCAASTAVEDFKGWEWVHGDEIVRRHRGVDDYLGGMLDAGEQFGVTILPMFSAFAYPSGIITRATYEALRDELLEALRRAEDIDAVCLALHGAGVAEGVDDLEAALLAQVREIFPRRVPLVATLDLHANVSPDMVAHADALLGVNFYPHTDSADRGQEAVDLAVRIARGAVRPMTALVRVPMLLPPSATADSPAREVNERCRAWEAREDVIDCTFFHGFPYADGPDVMAGVVAVADADAALAQEAAEDVGRCVWASREGFRPRMRSAAQAVQEALALNGQPIVVNETSDNPGGGAPGDWTHLLRALLGARVTSACFGFIYDPQTAAQAHEAGVGATIRMQLGGKTDALHGAPVEAEAYVKCLTDGAFIQQSPMWRGAAVNLGRMARLEIGGVSVLVSSVRAQTFDAEVFALHGIDVTRYKIVALKSSQHFRAAFEPLAAGIVTADPPGMTTRDVSSLPYRRLRRPIWPLDPDTAVALTSPAPL